MEFSRPPTDQSHMAYTGTVFHHGPVVHSIVDKLSLVDKFCLLQQIEEEDERRPPVSTSAMSGWKEAIKRALNNQRVISNYKIGDRYNSPQFTFFRLNRQDFTDDKSLVPDQWLAQGELTTFEQLLVLCPNVTGIHLIGYGSENFVSTNLLAIISSRVTKLTSVTLNVLLNDSGSELMMEILRKRKGRMQYIDITSRRLETQFVKELIEQNPNLTAICTDAMDVDFVRRSLCVNANALHKWTANGKLTELCAYFKRFNCNYQKSSSDGIKLKVIKSKFSVTAAFYEELIDSFTQLELLSIEYTPEVDIGRLKVMRSMRALRLMTGYRHDRQTVDELLSTCDKLEELQLDGVLTSETVLQQLHALCPCLRRLAITQFRIPVAVFSVDTLRAICQLAKLEYFKCCTREQRYEWTDRNAIDEKRLQLNGKLRGNE